MIPEGGALQLPLTMVGRADVARVGRELEMLEEFMKQMAVRKPGTTVNNLPRLSKILEDLARDNGLNLIQSDHRAHLSRFLNELKSNAPLIHISFAADPSAAFTQKLLVWLRREIHPMILLQIGLQPSIAAGCVIRTNNKQFDMSLRHRFGERNQLLLEKLKGTTNA